MDNIFPPVPTTSHDQPSQVIKGTVNAFILLDDCIYIGVDSRATGQFHNGQAYPWENINLCLGTDEAKKYTKLYKGNSQKNLPAMVITAWGDKQRNMQLWREMKKHIDNSERYCEINDVSRAIKKYLRKTHPLPPQDLGVIELYLAGFSLLNMRYEVHYLGDRVSSFVYSLGDETQSFCAIGSGGVYAMHALNYIQNIQCTEAHALHLMKKALTYASLYDPGCGGWLHIYKVTYKSSRQWKERLIPAAIQSRECFQDYCLVFLSVSSYHTMNYQVLDDCLVNQKFLAARTVEARHIPSCLGYVWNLNMFIVRFNGDGGRDLYKKASDVRLTNGVRYIVLGAPYFHYIDEHRMDYKHHLLVAPFRRPLLENLSDGTFFDQNYNFLEGLVFLGVLLWSCFSTKKLGFERILLQQDKGIQAKV